LNQYESVLRHPTTVSVEKGSRMLIRWEFRRWRPWTI